MLLSPFPALEAALGGNHSLMPMLKQGKLRHGSIPGARATTWSCFWGRKAEKPWFCFSPQGSEGFCNTLFPLVSLNLEPSSHREA